ncbi:MAG: glycosyltransferase family 2 protein [Pseudomonadota bacterium]
MIIPHLNAPEGLRRCLRALEDQRRSSGTAFRVYVVDNGSNQRPDEVCAAFDFVTLLSEAEPGPGPARNRAAREATAEILAFIDADCTPGEGWIETIVSYLGAHPETAVIGGEVYIDHVDSQRLTPIEAYESVFAYRMRLYYERERFTGTGNMAVRRADFERVGGFGGISIAEDRDWGMRATALGLRIDFVPEMTIKTPARETFSELARKWDRQLGHQFAEVDGLVARLRWALKALALLVSPLVAGVTILRSDRLARPRDRWLAFRVLARIRAYRARRMVRLLTGSGTSSQAAWRGS